MLGCGQMWLNGYDSDAPYPYPTAVILAGSAIFFGESAKGHTLQNYQTNTCAARAPAGHTIAKTNINSYSSLVASRRKQRGSAWPPGQEWTEGVIEKVSFRSRAWNCLKKSQRK
jgi:hypothetical protein